MFYVWPLTPCRHQLSVAIALVKSQYSRGGVNNMIKKYDKDDKDDTDDNKDDTVRN